MHKTITHKNGHKPHKTIATKHASTKRPIYHDVEKLKKSLAKSTLGMKNYAGQVLARSIRDAKAKSRYANRSVSKFTHKKPYSSLGIATAAGICIGFIINKIINS